MLNFYNVRLGMLLLFKSSRAWTKGKTVFAMLIKCVIASRTQSYLLFKTLEDMNLHPKACTLRNSYICFQEHFVYVPGGHLAKEAFSF